MGQFAVLQQVPIAQQVPVRQMPVRQMPLKRILPRLQNNRLSADFQVFFKLNMPAS